MMRRNSGKSGFSLVELSIVLIIVGVLVGGVMAGKNLIHAAKLRNTVSGMESFTAAVRNFRDQYGDLPGDLPTATQIWGTQSGCPDTASSTNNTCNGDGNGFIDEDNEKLRAWQHLSNAGFIEGMYTGAFSSGDLERGVNTPGTPIDNGVYELYYQGLYLGSIAQDVQLASAGWDPTPELYGRMGHHIKLGAIDGDRADNAVLSPIDARALDDKYDDGLADYGKMMARDGNDATDCVDGSDVYDLQNERLACVFYFWID